MKLIKYSCFKNHVETRSYKTGVMNNIFQFDEQLRPFPFNPDNTDLNLEECFLFAFRVSELGLYDYCICEVGSNLYDMFLDNKMSSPFLSELQNVRMKEVKADFTGYVSPSQIIRNLYQAGENLMNARDDLEYHFGAEKVDSEEAVNNLSYIPDDFEDITLTQGVDVVEVANEYMRLANKELHANKNYSELLKTQNTEEGRNIIENVIEQEVQRRLNDKKSE